MMNKRLGEMQNNAIMELPYEFSVITDSLSQMDNRSASNSVYSPRVADRKENTRSSRLSTNL